MTQVIYYFPSLGFSSSTYFLATVGTCHTDPELSPLSPADVHGVARPHIFFISFPLPPPVASALPAPVRNGTQYHFPPVFFSVDFFILTPSIKVLWCLSSPPSALLPPPPFFSGLTERSNRSAPSLPPSWVFPLRTTVFGATITLRAPCGF